MLNQNELSDNSHQSIKICTIPEFCITSTNDLISLVQYCLVGDMGVEN